MEKSKYFGHIKRHDILIKTLLGQRQNVGDNEVGSEISGRYHRIDE